ncbi:protein of unknown function (DU1801) [Mucilaginibacter gossypiicola]|uniref:YdhG-like domain-containing protein n=1 Tax=Mucilaginibacter gossypiicola TaxID=551995 RepID=A0A1H8Q902_9SPHI|nr:DUF1801 domain-containing protein [Mucilaginibacter gossypiicola]SEO50518.1 protein of unknown function (DU1801) [Mucilaginibacter gossypiicola]
MQLTPIDHFYLTKEEPNKSCLLALRDIILAQDTDITAEWKYNMPFFYYKGKMFCYLWIHKKTQHPFLGMVEGKHLHHPNLTFEDRARIKIMVFNPEEDLPVDTIRFILNEALDLYKSGLIKLPKKKR